VTFNPKIVVDFLVIAGGWWWCQIMVAVAEQEVTELPLEHLVVVLRLRVN
jgi:hypothetical protein